MKLKSSVKLQYVKWAIPLFLLLFCMAATFPSQCSLAAKDCMTWEKMDSGITGENLEGVTYGNGTFVAVGGEGAILTSADGVMWTSRTSGTPYGLYGVTYGNGRFMAVGCEQGQSGQGVIATSPNGVTWTYKSTSVKEDRLWGVTYGNGTFVAVGYARAKSGWLSWLIVTSSDGVTLTRILDNTAKTAMDLWGVTYGNGTFVAVGTEGPILTSADGVAWTSRTSRYSLDAVTYGNGTFVAVGSDGAILTSADGVTWTSRTSGTSSHLQGVTYGNGTFVAVGSDGAILTSADGVTWTNCASDTYPYLSNVTYGNDTFVAVGGRNILLSGSTGCNAKATFLDEEDTTRKVSGAAADGESQVVIQISDLCDDISENDIKITIPASDGALGKKEFKDGVFTQIWKAPEFYVREDHSSKDRTEGSRPIDLSITVDQQKLDIPEFTINKAPVVLLHGLWDKEGRSWATFKDKLKNKYGYKYVEDYRYTSTAYFKENELVIDKAINKALGACKDDGIVAKKADVVAHSMGGLLTKLYGNASNIKSITTIGTPHLGSRYANLLYALVDDAGTNSFEKFFAGLLAANNHNATDGAVEDLRERSDMSAIVERNKIDVPTHTIAGISLLTEKSSIFILDVIVAIAKVYKPLELALGTAKSVLAINQKVFHDERNDFMVSESSQKGGFGLKADIVYVPWHVPEPSNTAVMDNIVEFLHRTSNDSADGSSFVAAQDVQTSNYQQQRLQHELPDIKMADSSGVVTITQPTEGTVFHPGNTVYVTVTVSNKNAKVLIATSTGESTLVESAPYNFKFVIPEDSAGTITIMVAAIDDTGFIGSAKATITVAVLSKLTDIKAYPEDNHLYLTVGETVPLAVYGKYDDNITRKITSSSSGTNYTTDKPDIAEASSEGNITAKSQGDAVVTVENSKIKREITITVMPDETPTPTPVSSPTLTPIPTPTTTECTATSITASEDSLTIKKLKKSSVIVSVAGDGDCAVQGKKVTAKVNASGKKMVTVTPSSAKTGEDGSATFTLKAKSKTGNTSITFSTEDGLSGSVDVTVTK